MKRQSVHELVQRGIVPADENGLIDAEIARIALQERLRPSAKTAQAAAAASPAAAAAAADSSAPVSHYHVARTMRETAEARLAQLDLAERQGKLVATAAVEREIYQLCRATRDVLQSVGSRVAAIVAGNSSVPDCQKIIDDEIRAALQVIVDRMDDARPPLFKVLASELATALEPLLGRPAVQTSTRADLESAIDAALARALGRPQA